MDVRSPLVAYREPAVLRQPRQRALHHPPVAAQSLTAVFSSPDDAAHNAATAQTRSTAREIVGLVGVQLLGPPAWSASSGMPDRRDGVYLPSIQSGVKANPAATMRRFEAQVNGRRDDIRGEEGVGELEESIGPTVEAYS